MSLRVRLVLVYSFVAIVIGTAGVVTWVAQLRVGMLAAVDDALSNRADDVASDVEQTPADTETGDPQPHPVVPGVSVTQVYAPGGNLVSSGGVIDSKPLLQPAQLTGIHTPTYLDAHTAGDPIRLLAVPVQRTDGTWTAVVGAYLAPTEATIESVRATLIAGGIVLYLIGTAGVWLLAGAALRPVERMRRQVADLAIADPTARLAPLNTHDEIASLATTFNKLLERIHASRRHEQQFLADAGHELLSPLTRIRTELELALSPVAGPGELQDAAEHAVSECDRLGTLSRDLLFLARSDEGGLRIDAQPVPLAPLASDIAESVAGSDGPRIYIDVPATLSICVDPIWFGQAFRNVVDNAVRATPPAGAIHVEATTGPGGHGVTLTVTDTGPGFPPDFLPHAFERFRRGDNAHTPTGVNGTGLGLAIAKTIVKAHHGTISVANNPGQGACVTIHVPHPEPDAAASSSPA